MDGNGLTRLYQRDTAGNVRTSSGDALHMTLLPKARAPRQGASGALESAVQTGHVVVTQHSVAIAKSGSPASQPQDSHATAERAAYDAVTERLVLTGSPVVTAPGLQLAAERIDLLRATEDAEAQGSVKGTLVQGSAAEAVHVIAAHATVMNSTGAVRFSGGDRQVRMWSSTAQLQAPEILLDRAKGTLLAHAAVAGKGTAQLLLPASARSGQASGKGQGSGTLVVTGEELLMTAATAQAPGKVDMSGNVHIADSVSDLRARRAVATLKPAAAKQANTATSVATGVFSGGSVQSILATGDVHLQQPSRTGTGERLLYTEADSRYELTGTAAAPPAIADSLRGNITGTTLIFHGGDDSVEVAGETGRRVHTETHAARPVRSR